MRTRSAAAVGKAAAKDWHSAAETILSIEDYPNAVAYHMAVYKVASALLDAYYAGRRDGVLSTVSSEARNIIREKLHDQIGTD